MILKYYPYELQLRHTFTVASYSRSTTPGVQVEITHKGVVGYGEASMPPYLGESVDSVCRFLAKVDLQPFADPLQIGTILSHIDAIEPGNTAAKAAIDIALHDLVGKIIGEPWHRIWGLDASQTPCTTYTIGIDTPEMLRKKTMEVAGRFKLLKVKLGSPNDRSIIETIRSVSDLPLLVDANQGWKDKHQAIELIHWLSEQGVVCVEQPMPKECLNESAWITERSPLPIIADESVQRFSDVAALQGAFSGINVKLMKCTGMREAHKMITLARGLGMKVMLGCMTETSCAISAAAQLAPLVDYADLDGNLLIANDPFEGMTVVEGKITLNNKPGIGIIPIS